MQKFSKYKIKLLMELDTPSLATFVISPLEQGFGITLGNTLRRILLSSIPGPAVFAIKIANITHEHTTIPGVVEDISQIILNIKKLQLKVNADITNIDQLIHGEIENWPTLKIEKKEKGVIYASDIYCPPGFEILNPDLKICELTVERHLLIELFATVDRGYRDFKENREIINSINIIAIDSSFSPIIKVALNVVEEKTSKKGTTDRLEVKIATNGSISAADAFALSAQILKGHIEPIVGINEEISKFEVIKKEEDQQKKAVLSTPIDELELTMRSFNCLKRHGIHTIQELIDKRKTDVEKIRNLGKKSLKEIIRKLVERNLSFRDE